MTRKAISLVLQLKMARHSSGRDLSTQRSANLYITTSVVLFLSSLLERTANRRLFRGPFGTAPKEGVHPLHHFKIRNPANINLSIYNGKLYPLCEVQIKLFYLFNCLQGFPSSEMCPHTLKTLYPNSLIHFFFDFFGILKQVFDFVAIILSELFFSYELIKKKAQNTQERYSVSQRLILI